MDWEEDVRYIIGTAVSIILSTFILRWLFGRQCEDEPEDSAHLYPLRFTLRHIMYDVSVIRSRMEEGVRDGTEPR